MDMDRLQKLYVAIKTCEPVCVGLFVVIANKLVRSDCRIVTVVCWTHLFVVELYVLNDLKHPVCSDWIMC